MPRRPGVVLGLELTVLPETLGRSLPLKPKVLGDTLSQQVLCAVRRDGLGYFPALDYFHHHPDVDGDLLEWARTVAWLAAELTRVELRTGLRTLAPRLCVVSSLNLAFTLPSVRPGVPGALATLARHYAPDRLLMDVRFCPNTPAGGPQSRCAFVTEQARRGLAGRFARLRVRYCLPEELVASPLPGGVGEVGAAARR